jgi:molybdopterin-binding protein
VLVDIGDTDIGGPLIMSSITNESVDSLGLKVGGSVYVVVKASDVMIGVD